MISVDFAPNETWEDVSTSLVALFSSWKQGKALGRVRSSLTTRFNLDSEQIFLFLSGRSAIHSALKVLSVGPDDEVIVPAFTCEAVVLPILKMNAIPIYADIEKETYTSTLDAVKSAVTSKTKAIFLQHTFGATPKDREKIISFAASKRIGVIEDLAHGFADKICADHPETIKILSFGRSKAFSSVFGGALIVPKELASTVNDVYQKLSYPSSVFILRSLMYVPISVLIKSTYDFGIGKILHILTRAFKILMPEISQKEKQGRYDSWLDHRYPNALAVLLEAQLKRLDRIQANRNEIVELYQRELGIKTVPISRFPVLVLDRSKVRGVLHYSGVFLGNWYTQPVAPMDLDLVKMKYVAGSCPEAEYICDHVVNLPLQVSKETAREIVKAIKPNLI